MNPILLFVLNLIVPVLSLVYAIYMTKYLDATADCPLSDEKKDFRKVAVVVTWLNIAVISLTLLLVLITGGYVVYKQPIIEY